MGCWRLFAAVVGSLTLFACASASDEETGSAEGASTDTTAPAPDRSADEQRFYAAGCLACHGFRSINTVGPSFPDLSRRYRRASSKELDDLATRVREGSGAGRWGVLPMPPNPKVSVEEAQWLVETIMRVPDGATSFPRR